MGDATAIDRTGAWFEKEFWSGDLPADEKDNTPHNVASAWDEFYGNWDYEEPDPNGFAIKEGHTPVIGENITDDRIGDLRFGPRDIETVFAYAPGANDGPPWQMAGRLRGGLYFYFEASCDNTGFDCQGCSSIWLTTTYQALCTKAVPHHREV